ncbi:uncharacterized protein KD926_005657 [Aspergillus affinis]|uniref:uncharacterized protein n=1 Tax=Aspergillus affinis TaxID=1070780 RepID=UPI0022FE05E8|nr:uncharacterized protein KD926_005657 [Aspergillus affinis]KAI9042362.1 hypothetical protein KD926_005657 [Aspergillus affinis]
MKVALAGAGQVGLCLATEISKSEDELVVLTSTLKPSFELLKAEVCLTDYSLDNLKRKLDDCDAVVSTLSSPNEFYISAHTNILEACKKNPLREIGLAWAINHSAKVFDMYSDGLQKVTLTSTADTARAVLAVLRNSINNGANLSPVTLLSGHTLTYRELFQFIQSRDPAWELNPVALSEVLRDILEGYKENGPGLAIHQMRILGFTNANHNPREKALE